MDDRHKVSIVICLRCYKRWVSVRPVDTLLVDLVCPNCEMDGFVIETGEDLDNGYAKERTPVQ